MVYTILLCVVCTKISFFPIRSETHAVATQFLADLRFDNNYFYNIINVQRYKYTINENIHDNDIDH